MMIIIKIHVADNDWWWWRSWWWLQWWEWRIWYHAWSNEDCLIKDDDNDNDYDDTNDTCYLMSHPYTWWSWQLLMIMIIQMKIIDINDVYKDGN